MSITHKIVYGRSMLNTTISKDGGYPGSVGGANEFRSEK